jgi:RimJ/RimL family protein N-acetyltransferase
MFDSRRVQRMTPANSSTIRTTRLMLRPVRPQDIDILFAIFGDPATNTFNPSGPMRERADAEAMMLRWLSHWEVHGYGDWAVSMCNSPDAIIGFGGLAQKQFAASIKPNLGYRFATQVWGQGLATEFCDAAVRFGFEVLGLPEIWATVRENHQGSRRVLEKTGLLAFDRVLDPRDVPASILYAIRQDSYRIRLGASMVAS